MDAQVAQPNVCALDWRVKDIRADGSIVLESSGDAAATLQNIQALTLGSAYVILRTSGRSAGFVRVCQFDAARHPENTLSLENGTPVITLGPFPIAAGQHATSPVMAFRVNVGDSFTLADGRFLRGSIEES